MARGKLIVFEGLDRAGKSTQCQMLVDDLQNDGIKVRHMRFPDRTTPIGQMINSYLSGQSEQDDHVIHLLFSANRWEAVPSIQADLAAGTTIIVDRYYYSGCVYSAAKQNPSMSLEWCRKPEVGLPRPDLCLFLDISAEGAAKRGGYGNEKYEKKEMQDRVRELFETMMQKKEGEDFVRIDAGESMTDVAAKIRQEVDRCIERVAKGQLPLRTVEEW
ncbi:thymidylate kinase-domain-containing protein [Alternaria rosae]|uniref:thymidylate kinase-domain-containing protein n=1 Tax=Alternaria rosae TaxID=1187941 RepID=UPI001E8D8481|nr:thymidylate kinase-domain-containing protein [Alternaria rosae]KAH6881595.1 thymidylate kinase-domain-containing protein [Alternaria rosae]